MTLTNRISAFVQLGDFLKQFTEKETINNNNLEDLNQLYFDSFLNVIENARNSNGWFTPENVKSSISGICEFLNEEKIYEWLSAYPAVKFNPQPKRVGVILAGNIPLVGFHDFMSVLISGHIFYGKLSSKDDKLLIYIIKLLQKIEPEFVPFIILEENKLENPEAVIATGSNNSARYFEYYFAKYPHIIRKNRNSVAILSGNETDEELHELGNDIFQYYGLGCRNVSKLYVPEGYNFNRFFENIEDFVAIANHHKYFNNYEYTKAIYLVNQTPFLDNNFLILKEDERLSSPIGVVYFEYYSDLENIQSTVESLKDQIQCRVSYLPSILNSTPFGKAQQPQLWDYADDVDTVEFLIGL